MDVLLQILDGLVADVLASPELEIDQAVIGVVVRIRRQLQTEAFDQSPRRADCTISMQAF